MGQEVFQPINSISRALSSESLHRLSRILISRTTFSKSIIGVRLPPRSNRCSKSIAKVAQVVRRYTVLRDPQEQVNPKNRVSMRITCQLMGQWDMEATLILLKTLKRLTVLREAWANSRWWELWRKITLGMEGQTKFRIWMLTWVQMDQATLSNI